VCQKLGAMGPCGGNANGNLNRTRSKRSKKPNSSVEEAVRLKEVDLVTEDRRVGGRGVGAGNAEHGAGDRRGPHRNRHGLRVERLPGGPHWQNRRSATLSRSGYLRCDPGPDGDEGLEGQSEIQCRGFPHTNTNNFSAKASGALIMASCPVAISSHAQSFCVLTKSRLLCSGPYTGSTHWIYTFGSAPPGGPFSTTGHRRSSMDGGCNDAQAERPDRPRTHRTHSPAARESLARCWFPSPASCARRRSPEGAAKMPSLSSYPALHCPTPQRFALTRL
jgi:hypothetical protein